jgi:serine kinase of HPr protein (carbohydrate metabolism regulator)
MSVLHATTLARRVDDGVDKVWRGALIRGMSGSGKSDLALRALDAGWRLVADDRTLVWTSGGELYGRAPAPISGLLEARGVGVVPVTVLGFVRLSLVVDATQGPVERIPEPEEVSVLDVRLPRLQFDLRYASTLAKIGLALAGRAAHGHGGARL